MKTAAPHARGITHSVDHVRELDDSTFVVRMRRDGLDFEPGQYIAVGVHGEIDAREYSVYSAPRDDFIEILVKQVEGGYVSPRLRTLQPGQLLFIDGPFGFFTIEPQQRASARFYFIATGTGISPFHCFVRAYPGIDYTLLHGIRFRAESFDRQVYDSERYVACVSRESGGDFRGRVTDYLRRHPVDPAALCYLCGNCDMIYEAFDILKEQGVPAERLFAEVYF